MRRSRLLLLLPILLFWLVMTGWLLWRERSAPAVDPHLIAGRIETPTENWMGLFVDGSRVGYVHLQQLPETRDALDGVNTRVTTRIRLDLFGRSAELDLTGSAFRPYLENRADLEFRVRSGDYDFALEGKVRDGRLLGKVRSAGETIPLDLPVGDDLMLSAGFGSSVTFPRLEVGERVTVPSFDPMSLRATDVEVRCVAREVLTVSGRPVPTRVLEVDANGLETRAWVDDDGAIVRAETPLGIALERVTAQEALRPTDDPDFTDFLGLTAIRPIGERPFRGATRMLFRVSGVPEGELPSDELQRATGDGLMLRLGGDAALAAGAADDGAAGDGEAAGSAVAPPLAADELDRHLAPDAFVQSDHPRIRSTAETILEDVADDPWQRALALHRWVYETIEKEPALSIPSALEVLEQRRGDCNEHTVLYTALARAAGLPTRIAIGVVWSEELDGFYYHAWPEVVIDGRWRWIDPTLGQPVADATHVKILNGGIESWSGLLPWLGKMQIEIEEVS